jgi:CRISPR-associated endonuclease/helicase Cas3
MKGTPTTFWGKLERNEDKQVIAWHPLLGHCADVAACAEALLERTILRRRFATLAGKADLDEVDIARLSALAALHDIGKFNLGFQRKGDSQPVDVAGHVAEVLALFASDHREKNCLFSALPCESLATWCGSEAAVELLIASIGHHGKPVACHSQHVKPALWTQTGKLDPFQGIASLTASVRRWFPSAFASARTDLPGSPPFQHAFAGLVMLADWLGSDRHLEMFPYAESLDDRMPFARERAARSVAQIGLDPRGSRNSFLGSPPGFAAISEHSPHEAQAKVLALPLDAPGSLTILESETGSGKTEAALVRFVTMFQAGLVDGMTFALPTRTAATQLHGRVCVAIARAFPEPATRPPVIMAVPGYLQFDETVGQALAGFEVLWQDDAKERARYRGWAAERPKRYLAGAIAVGTIDQVLLSSLRVGHAHLRATSLLRHLLVVDEVHASDVYMNRILEEVLRFHLAAGGHAFLMSATLGSYVRQRLEHAALRANGLALHDGDRTLASALATPYPAVHHGRRNESASVTAIATPGLPKTIHVTLEPLADDPDTLAVHALEAARRGARVLVLRNTVADAVATQAALESHVRRSARADDEPLLLRVNGVKTLHHARFARSDRELLDCEIEARFGKSAPSRAGVVAVATQTVQQSLDLDADQMWTDLAPMDVLLQRFGRVHRHPDRNANRPDGLERARAIVVTADKGLDTYLRENGEAWGAHGAGTVYEDLVILEATRRRLERNGELRIPAQNRELVETTTHPEALQALAASLGGLWPKHHQSVKGRYFAHLGIAALNLVEREAHFGGYSFSDTGLSERVASRLGESDRRIEFERPLKGPFGLLVRHLNIPGWLVHDVAAGPNTAPTDVVASAPPEEQALRFTFGGARFLYDRFGLRRDDGSLQSDSDVADA